LAFYSYLQRHLPKQVAIGTPGFAEATLHCHGFEMLYTCYVRVFNALVLFFNFFTHTFGNTNTAKPVAPSILVVGLSGLAQNHDINHLHIK
jgi:hypothetical protein